MPAPIQVGVLWFLSMKDRVSQHVRTNFVLVNHSIRAQPIHYILDRLQNLKIKHKISHSHFITDLEKNEAGVTDALVF